ncbi:MAG: PIN domain-containing protein [Verrucomicrobia bacterium]|nr:PIN domain-containing protein [Verrucomicrobiota bacterium]
MPFVDTNILLYAVCPGDRDRAKSDVARQVLRRDDLHFSVQVFQEFYVQATRPTRHQPISHKEAASLIQHWLRFPVQENTVRLFQSALAAKARFQISYWDAAILEAARAMGCREVLSEDLNAGQDYDGVVVVNPFAAA